MIFSLSALWWRRIRVLWKLPDGIDWLRRTLGLVLMGRAMLSKTLIQFSIDGWSCVPSLLFTWGQTMVEVMKMIPWRYSFKRSHACNATVQASNPLAGHHQPMPSPETLGHPQASLLWGHCSFLLGRGAPESPGKPLNASKAQFPHLSVCLLSAAFRTYPFPKFIKTSSLAYFGSLLTWCPVSWQHTTHLQLLLCCFTSFTCIFIYFCMPLITNWPIVSMLQGGSQFWPHDGIAYLTCFALLLLL